MRVAFGMEAINLTKENHELEVKKYKLVTFSIYNKINIIPKANTITYFD